MIKAIQQTGWKALQWGSQTHHNRILSCGFLIGICYLIRWLGLAWEILIQGDELLFLSMGLLAYSGSTAWQQRTILATFRATQEEAFVGHFLILGGITAFIILSSSRSLLTLAWDVTLFGMIYSHWGIACLRKYPIALLTLFLGFYPSLSFLTIAIWQVLTPHNLLENAMAWMGGIMLRAMGQPAIAEGPFLSLPTGSVEIKPGCSGLRMAIVIALGGLLLGLFLKQRRRTILWCMLSGIVLALFLNVPRLVLMALAVAYWGKESFEFWHGPWGGQIFSAIVFTTHYYITMGLFDKKSNTQI